MLRRFLFGVCWFCLPGIASASVLVQYDFTGLPGDQVSTSASWTAAGVTAAAIRRGLGLETRPGENSMNARGWTAGDLSLGIDDDYFEWTVVPVNGTTLDIDQIAFAEQRSANGIREFTLRSSLDGYLSDAIAAPIDAPNPGGLLNHVLDLSEAFNAIASPVTFRLYGYRSESATNSQWRIANHSDMGAFQISGTVSGLPADPIDVAPGTHTPEPTGRLIWGLIGGICGIYAIFAKLPRGGFPTSRMDV